MLSRMFLATERARKPRRQRVKPHRFVRPEVECLEDRTLPSIIGTPPISGLDFTFNNPPVTPPDTQVASGPNYIVEGVNSGIRIIKKSDGSVVAPDQDFATFFGIPTATGTNLITDASVNYDEGDGTPGNGRFIVSTLDVDPGTSKGYLYIAVSDSDDPTGTWTNIGYVDLTETASASKNSVPQNVGATLWGDFDRFGCSKDAYVWTVNMYTFSSGGVDPNDLFDHDRVIALDKSTLAVVAGQFTNVKSIDAIGWNGPLPLSGKATNGSPTITNLSSTANLSVGMGVYHAGIPPGATIVSVGANSVTMSANATTTGTFPIQFGNIVNENLMPVRMHNPPDNSMWFDEEAAYGTQNTNLPGSGNALQLVKIPDILTANSDGRDFDPKISPSHFFKVTVPTYDFTYVQDTSSGHGKVWNAGDVNAGAQQMGAQQTDGLHLLQTNDTRLLSQDWRTVGTQQLLVMTQDITSTTDPGVAKARWYEIDTGTATPSLVDSGDIDPGAGVATYMPSAALDPIGDIGMTYLESSPNEFMSMWATGKTTADSVMQAPLLVKAGESTYIAEEFFGVGNIPVEPPPHRTGDFSGTAVDYDSSGNPLNAFVSANEYSKDFVSPAPYLGVWATDVVSFSVSPLPPPPGTLIEDFNSSHMYHLVYPPFTFNPSRDASHEGIGDWGLVNNPGTDWIYRDDAAAQVGVGHNISVWLNFNTAADGPASFAFGATSISGHPHNTYALVVDPTTKQLTLETVDLSTATATIFSLKSATSATALNANTWYRLEVDWTTSTSITGTLFDSTGTGPVSGYSVLWSGTPPSGLGTSGGIGFNHATSATGSPVYWDTVTDPPASLGATTAQVTTGGSPNGGGPNLGATAAQILNSLMLSIPSALFHALDGYFANHDLKPATQATADLVAAALQMSSSHHDGFGQDAESGGMGSPDDADNPDDPLALPVDRRL
jgi:hypothetical protein